MMYNDKQFDELRKTLNLGLLRPSDRMQVISDLIDTVHFYRDRTHSEIKKRTELILKYEALKRKLRAIERVLEKPSLVNQGGLETTQEGTGEAN